MLLFSADWCIPCQTIKPQFKELAESYPDIEFIVLDVAVAKQRVREFKIRGIPTVILLEEGELIGRLNVPESIEDIEVLLKL